MTVGVGVAVGVGVGLLQVMRREHDRAPVGREAAHVDPGFEFAVDGAVDEIETQPPAVGREQRERVYFGNLRNIGRAAITAADIVGAPA